MGNKTPVCAGCEYLKMHRCRVTGNNRFLGGPRAECMCSHPKAFSTFQSVCPRSPRMPGFVGYTKPGGNKPIIKTSPKWCPLRGQAENIIALEESKKKQKSADEMFREQGYTLEWSGPNGRNYRKGLYSLCYRTGPLNNGFFKTPNENFLEEEILCCAQLVKELEESK